MINIRINEMSASVRSSGIWQAGNTYILEDGTPLYPPLVKGRVITKVDIDGFRKRCEQEDVKASIKQWDEVSESHPTNVVQLELAGYWWTDASGDTHYEAPDEKRWADAIQPPPKPTVYDD